MRYSRLHDFYLGKTPDYAHTKGPEPTQTPEPPAPGWVAHNYGYDDPDHPHAVSSVVRYAGESNEYTDSFSYDANGNMTQRVKNGTSWTQTYNAENRLESVSNGTETWTFTYDGGGARVKEVYDDGASGGYTKLFLGGGLYEVEDPGPSASITRYYSIAGQHVAMRDSSSTQFLITDHLGSVAAVIDSSGSLVGEQRYMPFGGTRLTPGISETDFSYTGQRGLASVGLMDYNARWHSPTLGRFTQADTIVPNLFNPQSLNRYSYVVNNPLRFVDPSGHSWCEYQEICNSSGGGYTSDVELGELMKGDGPLNGRAPDGSCWHGDARKCEEKDKKEDHDPRRFDLEDDISPGNLSILDLEFWPFREEYPNINDIYYDYLENFYGGFKGLNAAAIECAKKGTSYYCNNPFWEDLAASSIYAPQINEDVNENFQKIGFTFFLNELADPRNRRTTGPDPYNKGNYEPWWLYSLMKIHPNQLADAKIKLQQYILEVYNGNWSGYRYWSTIQAGGPDA